MITVQFTGFVVRPAQLKETKAGDKYALFTVAVNDKDSTTYLNCITFIAQLAKLATYFKEGTHISCAGVVNNLSTYTDKQGVSQPSLSVNVHSVDFINKTKKKNDETITQQDINDGVNILTKGGYQID